MKKTLDFNKLAKAHKAKKAWELLQKEKNKTSPNQVRRTAQLNHQGQSENPLDLEFIP